MDVESDRSEAVSDWRRVVAVAALLTLSSVRYAAGASPAATLADLCPGTPDPCVVSGQFNAANGTVFDAGGRTVRLLDGAAISGSGVAKVAIVNASSIDLQEGSRLSTSPGRSPFYLPCSFDDGLSYLPHEPLSSFIGENPNGNWKISILSEFSSPQTLTGWTLEVCTEDGCTQFPSSDVPLAIPTYGLPVESDVTVATTGTITRVSVIGLTASTSYVKPKLISPSGTTVQLLDRGEDLACHPASSDTLDMDFADPTATDFDLRLQSTGGCTLGGEIALDAPAGGGNAGSIGVECQGATLGAGLKLHARGSGGAGGVLFVDAGAGAFGSSPGAAVDLPGVGSRGGIFSVRAGGSCTLDTLRLKANGGVAASPSRGGSGGDLTATCNGIDLTGSNRIELNGAAGEFLQASGGQIRLDAGSGGCTVGAATKLTAKSPNYWFGGKVAIAASGTCSLGGKVFAHATAKVVYSEGEYFVIRGVGGSLSADCGSIEVPAKTKMKLGTRNDLAGQLQLISATDVRIGAGSYLRVDGIRGYLSGTAIRVQARDACTVEGKLSGQSTFEQSGDIVFECEGFTLARSGQVRLSTGGSVGGTILVDTTGTASAEPPAACAIAGKIYARARSRNESLTGNGGTVDLRCGTTLLVEAGAAVDTSCGGIDGEGGTVFFASAGDTTINGKVGGSGSFRGSSISVDACDLTVSPTGKVTAGGYGGPISLVAHDGLTVQGSVKGTRYGSVDLRYRNSASVSGTVAPPPTSTQDLALLPCP